MMREVIFWTIAAPFLIVAAPFLVLGLFGFAILAIGTYVDLVFCYWIDSEFFPKPKVKKPLPIKVQVDVIDF